MAAESLSSRLAELESILDRAKRRFEEGLKIVEEAHETFADLQQALLGSPGSLSAEESEEAASKLLSRLKATGADMPETLCGGRLAVDPDVSRDLELDESLDTFTLASQAQAPAGRELATGLLRRDRARGAGLEPGRDLGFLAQRAAECQPGESR